MKLVEYPPPRIGSSYKTDIATILIDDANENAFYTTIIYHGLDGTIRKEFQSREAVMNFVATGFWVPVRYRRRVKKIGARSEAACLVSQVEYILDVMNADKFSL